MGVIETLNKLINTLTDTTGDVFTNDLTMRKKTHWLLEQIPRTIFGRIDWESDDATFAVLDHNDRKYQKTISSISADLPEEYHNKINKIATDYSAIEYAETVWTY